MATIGEDKMAPTNLISWSREAHMGKYFSKSNAVFNWTIITNNFKVSKANYKKKKKKD